MDVLFWYFLKASLAIVHEKSPVILQKRMVLILIDLVQEVLVVKIEGLVYCIENRARV